MLMRIIALWVCVLLWVMPVAAQSELADLQPDDWNQIDPGGDTICAGSTPYVFFVRPVSDSDNLLIYFQGGGACWNDFTCDTMSSFDPVVTAEDVYTNGIFDLENPVNPLLDYNMVYIPYCTADVFTGNRVVTYNDDVTIEHRGYINARAALDWAYANFPQPAKVLVTGSSAGALGAIFHAADVMEQYADVPVTLLGDGYVGLLPDESDLTDTWGLEENLSPTLAENISADTQLVVSFYMATANAFPKNTLAQFSTNRDQTQGLFYGFMGGGRDEVMEGIPNTLRMLADDLPNFRYFMAEGTVHTILARSAFYTTAVDGVTVRDWLTTLLAGEADTWDCCRDE